MCDTGFLQEGASGSRRSSIGTPEECCSGIYEGTAAVAVEAALTRPRQVASLLLSPPGGSLIAELTPDLRVLIETGERRAGARRLGRCGRGDPGLVGRRSRPRSR
jgi:hypothetical protein